MTTPRPRPRPPIGLAVVALLVAACASTPSPTPTPAVTAGPSSTLAPDPVPSVVPLPSRRPAPTATPTLDPFAGIPPLPADLLLPDGDFTITPESPRGMPMSVAVPFDLGHCGLFSPVDLDGSLWEPVAGTDGVGGPIDRDAEVGQLINQTPGQAMLVTASRLDWRSTQGPPVVVVFRRIPGARDYPGCQ